MGPERRQLDQLLGAMFRQDSRGRLVGDAPCAHILRTADACLCRVHAAMPDPVAARLQAVAAAPRGRPGQWAEDYAVYLSLVEPVATVTAISAGPLYGFPDDLLRVSDCVAVDASNLDLLRGCLDEWIEDAERGSPMVAALVDGHAISICASVGASQARIAQGSKHRWRIAAGGWLRALSPPGRSWLKPATPNHSTRRRWTICRLRLWPVVSASTSSKPVRGLRQTVENMSDVRVRRHSDPDSFLTTSATSDQGDGCAPQLPGKRCEARST